MLMLLAGAPADRLFGLDQQTLIQVGFVLLNVSLLAVILTFLLYKPVRNFLHKRADGIKNQLEQAAADMAKANELRLIYEQKLKDIDLERNTLLDTARRLDAEKSRQILAEAKQEADAIKQRAFADIGLERERVKEEMKQAIIEISAALAEKYLARAVDGEIHDRLFAETLAEMEDTTWQS